MRNYEPCHLPSHGDNCVTGTAFHEMSAFRDALGDLWSSTKRAMRDPRFWYAYASVILLCAVLAWITS